LQEAKLGIKPIINKVIERSLILNGKEMRKMLNCH